jgi:myosin-5
MLMRYLANVTQLRAAGAERDDGDALISTSMVEEQVLQANPVLEAFGNACTVRNYNSSRFAKFTKLFFSTPAGESKAAADCRILGAMTETYLLERSRVVRVARGERNFHVFYQLCAAANSAALNQSGSLELRLPDVPPATHFRILCGPGDQQVTLPGVSDADNFEELSSCLSTMGVAIEEQEACFSALAGLLYLGNVDFNLEGAALDASARSNVERAAELLGLAADNLAKRLMVSIVRVRGEAIEKKLSTEDARSNRDSIAKALYNSIFEWVRAR